MAVASGLAGPVSTGSLFREYKILMYSNAATVQYTCKAVSKDFSWRFFLCETFPPSSLGQTKLVIRFPFQGFKIL